MDIFAWLDGAWAWAAPLGALAAIGLGAAALLLRDRRRLQRHAVALEAEVEHLHDRLWALAESEERHRSLVEAQRDLIVRRDGQDRITFANDVYARLTGLPRSDLIGSTAGPRAVERGPVRTRPDGARLVDEAIATDEGVRWIAWIETTLAAGSGRVEILRAGRDVTERVVSERVLEDARARAEAASEAKSRFLATVSHEFRTPLNGILGMTELILDTPLSPEQTTYVHAIKTSGDALLSLIDEILDFSKIEAGKLELSAEPFDLHHLIEGVVELLAPRAQGKGIEISSFVAQGVPRRVIGDGDRLRQVLVNLAGNAVKFTDVGGVGIRVERGSAGTLVLSVGDTGPGIAPDRLPLLFAEFEQGDGSPSRRHGGTGLGLAITRRIVERMQGEIQVESTLGQGSIFRVSLPLPDADGERPPSAPVEILRDMRVLILARSPFEAPFLALRLRDAGASVVSTDTAIDALAKIATTGFDALIADCALGEDAVRQVADEARRAGIARCIILLSPFERRDFGSPGASGFNGYLVKPVRSRSLFKRLSEPLAAEARPAVPAHPRAARAVRAGRGNAARVLLAEDNEINALLALKSLEKLGAVVDWAKHGQEALALAEASLSGVTPRYDLILMDIRMPGLDGHETTRRIRKLEEALGSGEPYRIVALTANALKEEQAAARAAGLDGFLAKPFNPDALRALLLETSRPLANAS